MEEILEIQQTLYQRLGGAKGIASLVDDILEAHMRNPVIKARFLPYLETPERLNQSKKHLCDFLGSGCGGTEKYTGRDMRSAHRGMNISEAEYMATIDDILKTMEEHGLDEPTRKDVLAITYSLKGDIIRV